MSEAAPTPVSCAQTPLSPAQETALRDPRPRVLVSAAAGSGKTRLLVARFVRALVEEGVPAERVVAVTFTRAAATELAERVRSELLLQGRRDLARSLDAAIIGTIHSLCRYLIKEHALDAQVDPSCLVLDEEEARTLKEKALELAWEQVLEEADEAELAALAQNGKGLPAQAIGWYDQLRALGEERPLVRIPAGPSETECRAELITVINEALREAGAIRPQPSSLQQDLTVLADCLSWLEMPLTAEERADQLQLTLNFFPSRRSSRGRSGRADCLFAPVREALTKYRTALAEQRLRPFVEVANRLLCAFHEHYEALKRERGVLDFADLELKARDLVLRGGHEQAEEENKPSNIKNANNVPLLAGATVLVDEFQDTNELQCSILESLGAERLLMVGDERQSIYRFRGADVDVFRRRAQALEAGGGDACAAVVRLDMNYRSSPEIIAFLNYLFSQDGFFGAEFSRLTHPELSDPELEAELAGWSSGGSEDQAHPSSCQPAVEVLVADRCVEGNEAENSEVLTIQEAEARVVADRVRRLLDVEGCKEGDIAILLPAYTYVDIYQRALRERGIEVYLTRGRQFFSREEIRDLIAFLRILVNPYDDLALAAVLRSPLVGLSDDGLYQVAKAEPGQGNPLWDRLRRTQPGVLSPADGTSIDFLLARFAELRQRVGRPGIGRLIEDIMNTFDYDLRLLALPDGKRRFANVRKLMRMADKFEVLAGPDLAGFVETLRTRAETDDREGEASVLGEAENVVQVSTIHQAKGLEFPVVIVAGLGSQASHGGGSRSTLVIGDDGRVGIFLRNSRRGTYEDSDLCWGPAGEIEEEIKNKEQAEDVRLLYVAMTRAKEQLILVGASTAGSRGSSRMKRILEALGVDESLLAEKPDIVPLETGASFLVRRICQTEGEHVRAGTRSLDNVCASELSVCGAIPAFFPKPMTMPRPRQVSFSALSLYQHCPRRFFLERVLGLGEEAGFEKMVEHEPGEAAAWERTLSDEAERKAGIEVGLLVHALLERVAASKWGPATESLRELAESWAVAAGLSLDEAKLKRALGLTLAFWESPLVDIATSSRALREVPFLFEHAGLLVSGVMDVLCSDGCPWRIIDYKTNRLGGRCPGELVKAYSLQAVVYCLAALRAGAAAVEMDFVFLERASEPVPFLYESSQQAELEAVLDQALSGLEQGEYEPRPDAHCGSCPVGELCGSVSRANTAVARGPQCGIQ